MLECLLFVLTALVGGIILANNERKKMRRRIAALEEDLARYAEVVDKIAEVQSKSFEKFSRRFDEQDERLLDLSVPSRHTEMPLEKRHQVLALAKQGVPLDEIVERVKAPVGEAELILNLRKYQSGFANNASASRVALARAS